MRRYGVFADDLTGSMDAGMQFLKKKISARVCMDPRYLYRILEDTNMVVIDTETRNVSKNIARKRITQFVDLCHENNIELIYKKIDSTLRGNIGEELDVVLEKTNTDIIFFAPALPENNRRVKNGYHYIGDKKIGDSEISKDPLFPVRESFIADIIGKQIDKKSYLISLQTLRANVEALLLKIEKLNVDGYKIMIFDSEVEEDLNRVAFLISKIKISVLPCGSAGLLSSIISNNS